MGLFDFIPEPRTSQGRAWLLITGLLAGLWALWYLINGLDFLPDTLGPIGFIDDIVIALLLFAGAYRLYTRVSGRVKGTKSEWVKLYQSGSLIQWLLKPKTWGLLLLIAAAFSYMFWTLDLIPDGATAIGYVDDAIVMVSAFIPLWRTLEQRRR